MAEILRSHNRVYSLAGLMMGMQINTSPPEMQKLTEAMEKEARSCH
jgi:hypothetical protein